MNRPECRRQERENRKQAKTIGVLIGGPSPAVLPVVHEFIGEHTGHSFEIEDNLENVLTLRCVDCEDEDEIDEG